PRCARCATRRGSAHSGKLPCRPSRGGRVSTCVRQSRRVSGAVRSARSSDARPARILCRLPAPTTGPAHVLHPRSGIGAGGWCTIVAMSTHTPTAAPRVLPEEIAALRTDLTAASYRSATIAQLLGPVAADALRREDPVPALRVLEGRGGPEGALPSLGVDGARRLGLLETVPADGTVRALFDLAPYSASDDAGQIDWWIASDLSELATGRPLGPEHVLGVGGASLTLARITPRTRVGRVLDLGCGGGIQALHAAR